MLQAEGVELSASTEVAGFETAGGRVRRVITNRGDFTPGEVVIAAGAWSAQWARKLGVGGLSMQPAKGYSITVRAPANGPRVPVLLGEGKIAMMPLGEQLRIGGTLQLAGMNTAVAARRVDGIRRTVRSYLPRMEATETVETWSGLRPCTPDSMPFIGRAGRYGNLSVAFGHGYIGMGLAPATGELIAQIIAGKEPDIDPAPLRPDRFHARRAGAGR
jgi:D-amino-acid dehydrogenase